MLLSVHCCPWSGNNTSQGSHHSSQPAAVASRQLRSTQRYASPVIVTHAAPNAQASMSNGGTDLTGELAKAAGVF